jgi:hypothetical protein
LLRRTVQQIRGVVGQFLAAIHIGSCACDNGRAVAENHDLLPPGSAGEVVVEVGELVCPRADIEFRLKNHRELHSRQAAGALGKYHLMRDRSQIDSLAINLKSQSLFQSRLFPIEVARVGWILGRSGDPELPHLLISRNLRPIHQVEDLDRCLLDSDLRVVVHAEIPHGMRERRPRDQ